MLKILTLIWQAVMRLVSGQGSVEARLAELQANYERILHGIVNLHMGTQHLQELSEQIIALLTPEPAVKLVFTAITEDGEILEEVTNMQMTYTQKVDLKLTAVDKKGNPAVLDGVPEWLSGNTDLVTIQNISSDGMSATAVATGALGATTITVTGDAKLGPEVSPIIGGLDINITPGSATQITVTPGTPAEQE